MDSLRGDEHRRVWCGEPLEPDWQGCVVIDEGERCYAEFPEAYYDPERRVVPRAYGHGSCFAESIRDGRNQLLQDVKFWWEGGLDLDRSVNDIHQQCEQLRASEAAADADE